MASTLSENMQRAQAREFILDIIPKVAGATRTALVAAVTTWSKNRVISPLEKIKMVLLDPNSSAGEKTQAITDLVALASDEV